jgi:hypothetical protein
MEKLKRMTRRWHVKKPKVCWISTSDIYCYSLFSWVVCGRRRILRWRRDQSNQNAWPKAAPKKGATQKYHFLTVIAGRECQRLWKDFGDEADKITWQRRKFEQKMLQRAAYSIQLRNRQSLHPVHERASEKPSKMKMKINSSPSIIVLSILMLVFVLSIGVFWLY